jgi:hypothetical protein
MDGKKQNGFSKSYQTLGFDVDEKNLALSETHHFARHHQDSLDSRHLIITQWQAQVTMNHLRRKFR